MISPILIPSKGRAGKSKTIERLIQEKLSAIIFIEPQDKKEYFDAYELKGMKLMLLEQDNAGIASVRQKILDYARSQNFNYYWTLDDDIQNMYRIVEGGKSVKVTFTECLAESESQLRRIKNLAIGALEYNQFAWSQKHPMAFNSYCEVSTFINVSNTRMANYRTKVNLKEDRDFVLQNLANGYVSARTSWCSFAAPKNGSNKGGLYDEYAAGKEREQARVFCEQWPGICEPIVKKDGRCDAKINWRAFKTLPIY